MVKHILYLRFICLLTLVSASLSLPAIADDGAMIPVKLNAKLATFFDGLDPAWITDPLAGLAAPFPKKDEAQAEPGYAVMLQTLNVDGRHRSKVFNCNEMLKLDAEGFIAAPEGTSLSSYNLYGRCELLSYLAKAKPSSASPLQQIDFEGPNAPEQLPALALPKWNAALYHKFLSSWREQINMKVSLCGLVRPPFEPENMHNLYTKCAKNDGPYPKAPNFEINHESTSPDLDMSAIDVATTSNDPADNQSAQTRYLTLAKADLNNDGFEDWLLVAACADDQRFCDHRALFFYTDEGLVPWGANLTKYNWSAPLFLVLSKPAKTSIAHVSNLCDVRHKMNVRWDSFYRSEGPYETDGCLSKPYANMVPFDDWPQNDSPETIWPPKGSEVYSFWLDSEKFYHFE